ncbi:uncharacterized protein Triagg1_10160 [Trichoderma aggressivum f. europaeum]|uniref:Peptidase C14 caspase domain-containing protein n=1 Tax=Trichoderma aggressivum f. europaeum TaxID=173218 RepID=A0AAE1IXJ9_9HYPO|nr:hypothetical protein Triagg1_10160 [Trichoderma aggressivum f. europaeum]
MSEFKSKSSGKWALLIASPFVWLKGPMNDVATMKLLLDQCGFEAILCCGEEAVRKNILESWEKLIAKVKEDDVVVVFYSGYGGRVEPRLTEDATARVVAETDRPEQYQFIVPMDYKSSGEFKGILDVEISVLVRRTTDITKNVTVIFDCCYSENILSDPWHNESATPKGLPLVLRRDLSINMQQLRYNDFDFEKYINLAVNENPVWIVAAADSETAWEYIDEQGKTVGALTKALVPILNQALKAGVSWKDILPKIREQVNCEFPQQHPQVEGACTRMIFSKTTKDPSTLDVLEEYRETFINAGSLAGVRAVNTYVLTRRGYGETMEERNLAQATVESITGLRSHFPPLPPPWRFELPEDGPVAILKTEGPLRWPVALDGELEPFNKGLVESRFLKPQDRNTETFVIAHIRKCENAICVFNASGIKYGSFTLGVEGRIQDEVEHAIKLAEQSARVHHLLTLKPSLKERLSHKLDIRLSSVSDTGLNPIRLDGLGKIAVGDRAKLFLQNFGAETIFVTLFNITVMGEIFHLSPSSQKGIQLAARGVYAYKQWQSSEATLDLEGPWLGGFPEDFVAPIPVSLVCIVTNSPVDLRDFTSERQRHARESTSQLERLVHQLAHGLSRDYEAEAKQKVPCVKWDILISSLQLRPHDRNWDLLEAAMQGQTTRVKQLLSGADIDINFKDKNNRTPLLWAAENGNPTLVEVLLATDGIEPNIQDISGQTPLLLAVKNMDERTAELLLAKDGIDPDIKDKYGQTPLSWAAKHCHTQIVKLLLEKDGVEPNIEDENGQTLLLSAVKNSHEEVVKLLLAKDGVDQHVKDRHGRTPLSWAAGNGDREISIQLLEHGVEPDVKDNYGRTPLSWAAGNGYERIVILLLDLEGVDLNSRDTFGRTPLWWAVGNGQTATAKLLLDRGVVDLSSKDSFDHSIISWDTDTGNEAAVELLILNVEADAANIKPLTSRKGSGQKVDRSERNFMRMGEGFIDFEKHLASLVRYTHMELKINWEVPQAMQLYRNGVHFSTILTISGNETDAQAAVCKGYALEHFPKTGKVLLDYVQAAWDSEESLHGDEEVSESLNKVSVRFKHLQDSEYQTAIVTASGTLGDLTELARAFTWLCCAIRPAQSGNICLSTFQFCLYTRRDSPDSVIIEVQLLPLREANNRKSCWRDLFTNAIIALDAPISDRSRFREIGGNRRDFSIPKGLDIPFDIMVNLAAVNYPFEYEDGIVLKGSATLLAATAAWETHAGTAFQWHLVSDGGNGISLSEYTDKYHIYQGEGNSASFKLELLKNATRTFLGWCGSYLIQLANVDPAAIEVTQLSGAGAFLILKSLGINAGVSKSPASLAASVTFEVQNDSNGLKSILVVNAD